MPPHELVDWSSVTGNRVSAVSAATASGHTDELAHRLLDLSVRGLRRMYEPATRSFPQTMRGQTSATGPVAVHEGNSLRYAAIVALGVSRLPVIDQRQILDGATAAELAAVVAERSARVTDMGAVALAAWALAEVSHTVDDHLMRRLSDWASSSHPVATVQLSWALMAALEAGRVSGLGGQRATMLAERLRAAQGPSGAFPHMLPADAQGRVRAHVGCFADQVYPVQALARLAARTPDQAALGAANRCAGRIVAVQGAQGQWWWHYDVRDGSIVEGFPVYSVHQHAMGPMALFELADVPGGGDHLSAIGRGMDWLVTHPEVVDELIADELDVVWRKVGRREPAKAARALGALTTAVRPGLHLPGLDSLFPPTKIDHECRPYELGWLLYAWASQDAARGDRPSE